MEQRYKTNSFTKLLDRLQEDSWQLELLISGFAIFGLFYALEPVSYKLLVAQYDNNTVFVNFLVIAYFSLQILIFNLLVHVLLRAIWIGSLGLRYVFGEIDYDQLNYSEQFTKYLKKKVGSFDAYIGKLENICSVIFAITFLLVFYVVSFFIIGFILTAFNNQIPDWMIGITRLVFAFFSAGALLVFFDFITQGLLKKNEKLSKIYFPVYWLFSYISLSFLYRPLVYNLLDNKYGRRIGFILIPFYVLVYIVFHLEYQKSNFITQKTSKSSNTNIANASNYQDLIDKNKNIFISEFAIQSKVIVDPYIKLSIPINNKIEDDLIDFNPKLKPEIDKRGLRFRSEISFIVSKDKALDFSGSYLETFENKYRFTIDNKSYNPEFVISNSNNEMSFESYIGIQDLSEGKHSITFQSLSHNNSDSIVSIREVPFWYYKD
jgi:hypothetical protein